MPGSSLKERNATKTDREFLGKVTGQCKEPIARRCGWAAKGADLLSIACNAALTSGPDPSESDFEVISRIDATVDCRRKYSNTPGLGDKASVVPNDDGIVRASPHFSRIPRAPEIS